MKTTFITTMILLACKMSNAQDLGFKWAGQIGGAANEYPTSITLDKQGNLYTTGYFSGIADFDPGPGVSTLTSLGGEDIFISKIDPSGNFVWAVQFAGSHNSSCKTIAVDSLGNVYTTGDFMGTLDFDPDTSTTFNLTAPTNVTNIFVSKLNASGNFVWAKRMVSTSYGFGNSIAVDIAGNVYTTGSFQGITDFDPGASTVNLTSAGSNDVYISKLDPSGSFAWVAQLGGTSGEGANAIAVDPSGNVYTAGTFMGTADFDPGSFTYNLTASGYNDIFISRLSASGSFVWAQRIGGSSSIPAYDLVKRLSLDKSGNVYTTGNFADTVDFDPNLGTFNLVSAGYYDLFFSKLDKNGDFVWAKRIGGPQPDESSSAALDNSGNLYVIAQIGFGFDIIDFDPGTGNYILPASGSMLVELDSTGNFVLAKKMTKAYSGGIVVDILGNIYLVGGFSGTIDFNPGSGIFNLDSPLGNDIFLQKTGPCTNTSINFSPTFCISFNSPSGKHTWTKSGVYYDTIPNASGCDSFMTVNLTIDTVNTVVIQNGNTLFASTSGAAYQWINCNGNTIIQGETNQTFVPSANGQYAVIINQNNCSDTSACFNVNNVGLSEPGNAYRMEVFPNPATNEITILINSKINNVSLRVANAAGQTLVEKTQLCGESFNLDVSEMACGIYLLEVRSNENISRIKFLKN